MSMSYKVRDYFILTDNEDELFHHTVSTMQARYEHFIVLRTDITHRETGKNHSHHDMLLTDDLNKITEDVMAKFVERCNERCEAGNFEINYREVWIRK